MQRPVSWEGHYTFWRAVFLFEGCQLEDAIGVPNHPHSVAVGEIQLLIVAGNSYQIANGKFWLLKVVDAEFGQFPGVELDAVSVFILHYKDVAGQGLVNQHMVSCLERRREVRLIQAFLGLAASL